MRTPVERVKRDTRTQRSRFYGPILIEGAAPTTYEKVVRSQPVSSPAPTLSNGSRLEASSLPPSSAAPTCSRHPKPEASPRPCSSPGQGRRLRRRQGRSPSGFSSRARTRSQHRKQVRLPPVGQPGRRRIRIRRDRIPDDGCPVARRLTCSPPRVRVADRAFAVGADPRRSTVSVPSRPARSRAVFRRRSGRTSKPGRSPQAARPAASTSRRSTGWVPSPPVRSHLAAGSGRKRRLVRSQPPLSSAAPVFEAAETGSWSRGRSLLETEKPSSTGPGL